MEYSKLHPLIAVSLLALPLTLRGDVAGTASLNAGQALFLPTGSVSSGQGDIVWTGTALNFISGSKAFDLTGNQASAFPNFSLSQAQADASAMSSSPLPVSTLVPGNLFLVETGSGYFAKVLVTAQSGTSITLQYDAFAPAPAAISGPITYTLTGSLQGNVNGQNFNNSFALTVTAATGGITNPSSGVYVNPAISSYLTINGVMSGEPLQNVNVIYNSTLGQIEFGSVPGGAIGMNISAAQMPSNLATAVGPVTGTGAFVPGSLTTASGTTVAISGVTAAANAASPLLLAYGLPTITSISNAASNQIPGTGNAQIAQGSIFILQGIGLGPESISISPTPFQTTEIAGTSVTFYPGGASTGISLPLYYASATQVAALMPSSAPAGGGNFTVTYNAHTSVPLTHGTVSNNLGIFTFDSTGQGPGIVTYPDYSLVSAVKMPNCIGPGTAANPEPYVSCGAANPGDTLILWATGLGPVTGSDTASSALGQAINVPLSLYLGGVQMPISFQGRGCCFGEDQIVFTIPMNVPVPTGCAVPLVAQVGTGNNIEISNTVVMPVAVGSRNCTPSNPAMQNLEQAVTSGTLPFNVATLTLSRDPNGNGYQDDAKFEFLKVNSINSGTGPSFVSWIDDQPPGTCIVYNSLNPNQNTPISSFTGADAGSNVTITSPATSLAEAIQPGENKLTLSTTGSFLNPGTFTLNNGTGGADIGGFKASVTIPSAPTLTSPTQANASAGITRSGGMTVNWTGGSANGNLVIAVSSATDVSFTLGSTAACFVQGSAGSFTIPSYVMLSLLSGNFANLSFQPNTPEVPVTGPGIGFGELQVNGAPTNLNVVLK